jgi:mannan endo-1,4-beta-mannosidase
VKNFVCLFSLLLLGLLLAGCSQPATSELADHEASHETTMLYHSLFDLAEQGIMFGHHEAMAYGVGWWGQEGRSDVKEVCGSYPAVHGWDIGKIGTANSINGVPFKDVVFYIREVYQRGGINTVAWHMDNSVSGGHSWDTTRAVPHLLPGGKVHAAYLEKLDLAAQFFKSCQVDGKLIPIIFRPFHEHNGDWFWWGKGHCSEEEFIRIWQFTFDYLKKEKGVNNLIYAFSPDRSRMELSNGKTEYLYGYPGDAYVDIIGLDNYWDVGHEVNDKPLTRQKEDLVRSLKLISSLAADKGKIAALTETGMEKVPLDDWYTHHILNTIKEAGDDINLSYIMVWRNANPGHHYVPYAGHPAEADFRQFCQDELILLEDDISNVYSR